MNIPSATVLASPNVNGWPSPSSPFGLVFVTRLDSVRLRCGSVFRSAGASTLRIAPHAADIASCAMFNSHVQLLSFGQSFQAFHDAPRSEHEAEGFDKGLHPPKERAFSMRKCVSAVEVDERGREGPRDAGRLTALMLAFKCP